MKSIKEWAKVKPWLVLLAFGVTVGCGEQQPAAEPKVEKTEPVVEQTTPEPKQEPPIVSKNKPQFGDWGVDLEGMDKSIKPGDDFYGYVNGTWHKNATIAGDKTQVGPLSSLQDLAFEQVKALVEEIAAKTDAAPGSDDQVIGDWYTSMMDEDQLQSLGVTPLKADINEINAIESRTDLADLLVDNLADLGCSPLSISADFDRQNKGVVIPSVSTSGLSMPSREIYLDEKYAAVRTLFRDHVARVFSLLEMDNAETRADAVLAMETQFAENTLNAVDARDNKRKYNAQSPADLSQLAPGIDWSRFLQRSGAPEADKINLKYQSQISGMAKLIAEAPLDQWKNYCHYKLMTSANAALPINFRDEFFSFYGKVLSGQSESDPRWKQSLIALGWQGKALQDMIGKKFVEKYVSEDARPQVKELTDGLIKAFDRRLEKLEWMTETTRKEAREKLSKTTIKLIYPDTWVLPEQLEIKRDDAMGNLKRSVAYLRQNDVNSMTEYPDRKIFFQPVYLVNAYAMAAWNEIVFLAAIVRPPSFDPNADPAVNYGGIGAIIGHEISHLFDDKGRESDGDGLLRDWWQPEDAEKFMTEAKKLSDQVSTYEPLPGKHINDQLTLGESLADVAGLVVAYDAFKMYSAGKDLGVVDGFTPDQRFFLGYAQQWRWKATEATLDDILNRDPHPPNNFRPQTVRNFDAWYEVFDVQPGDKLYLPPDERVKPW